MIVERIAKSLLDVLLVTDCNHRFCYEMRLLYKILYWLKSRGISSCACQDSSTFSSLSKTVIIYAFCVDVKYFKSILREFSILSSTLTSLSVYTKASNSTKQFLRNRLRVDKQTFYFHTCGKSFKKFHICDSLEHWVLIPRVYKVRFIALKVSDSSQVIALSSKIASLSADIKNIIFLKDPSSDRNESNEIETPIFLRHALLEGHKEARHRSRYLYVLSVTNPISLKLAAMAKYAEMFCC